MDDLILVVNLKTAEGLASQAKLQHIALQRDLARGKSTTQPAENAEAPVLASGFFVPRLIPIDPPKSTPGPV